MKIKLTSVWITDIDKALAFYEGVLGFVRKRDIPMGEARLVTLVSPEEPDAAELMLEPVGEHPDTMVYKKALYEQRMPIAAFEVDDIEAEHKRLEALGARFTSPPKRCGIETMATLDDTCGNFIMIYQTHPE